MLMQLMLLLHHIFPRTNEIYFCGTMEVLLFERGEGSEGGISEFKKLFCLKKFKTVK